VLDEVNQEESPLVSSFDYQQSQSLDWHLLFASLNMFAPYVLSLLR